MVTGQLGHREHEKMNFSILGEVWKEWGVVSRMAVLDFQRADFGLFTSLVDGIPDGDSSEGPRGPGGLGVLQDGSLKGT